MHWFKPSASKKYHIFSNARSLCMKCGFPPPLDEEDAVENPTQRREAMSGDCKECVKRFNDRLPKTLFEGK